MQFRNQPGPETRIPVGMDLYMKQWGPNVAALNCNQCNALSSYQRYQGQMWQYTAQWIVQLL